MFAEEFAEDGGARFAGEGEGRRNRYMHLRAAPARILPRCLNALHRGDAVVVLTGYRASSRAAVLGEVARLAGRGYARIVRLNGSEIGQGFAARMAAIGLHENTQDAALPTTGRAPLRTMLIVEESDMVSDHLLCAFARIRDTAHGAPVQVLLAGSGRLLVKLCQPPCMPLWRKVRLTLTIEERACPSPVTDLGQLEDEIARTEARLSAQRRILSIFADEREAETRSAFNFSNGSARIDQ